MTEEECATLAALLKSRREALGLSARETARQAGIDNSSITLLEQCKVRRPRVETLRSLSKVLEIPLMDLLAAMNWLPEKTIPSLRPYMHTAYAELSDEAITVVELLISELTRMQSQSRKGFTLTS